jgi:hypothetical protein
MIIYPESLTSTHCQCLSRYVNSVEAWALSYRKD